MLVKLTLLDAHGNEVEEATLPTPVAAARAFGYLAAQCGMETENEPSAGSISFDPVRPDPDEPQPEIMGECSICRRDLHEGTEDDAMGHYHAACCALYVIVASILDSNECRSKSLDDADDRDAVADAIVRGLLTH